MAGPTRRGPEKQTGGGAGLRFHEWGTPERPTVVLLHGAGLSWWAWRDVAALLEAEYRIVLPVIDGYGEEGERTFRSIEDSAQTLIEEIDRAYGGRVFALGGLSLGAQIAAEALSRRPGLAEFAVLESALVCPSRLTQALAAPVTRLSFGLIRRRWFARLQARALMVPEALFEAYYADSLRLSEPSLIHTLRSNAAYTIKPGLADCGARALILAGGREAAAMRCSVRLLHGAIPGSGLCILPGLRHGELSLRNPERYALRLRAWFAGDRDAACNPILHP